MARKPLAWLETDLHSLRFVAVIQKLLDAQADARTFARELTEFLNAPRPKGRHPSADVARGFFYLDYNPGSTFRQAALEVEKQNAEQRVIARLRKSGQWDALSMPEKIAATCAARMNMDRVESLAEQLRQKSRPPKKPEK